MHACMALPQPLRWFMGRWANEMNILLSGLVRGRGLSTVHRHPETTTVNGMAMDGLHPSSQGYALWADGLSELILATDFSRQVRQAGHAPDSPSPRARGWPRRLSAVSPQHTVWQGTGL
jgi:hypothetical protein